MTSHLIRMASAAAGVLIAVAADGAQIVVEPISLAPPHPPSLIRLEVAPPSFHFTRYVEGELVRVSVPSNWREFPGFNRVTFAPEGGYENVGLRSVFTHGLGVGLARHDNGNLRVTTDAFIDASVLGARSPGKPFRHVRMTLGKRPGLRTTLSRVSEATGELERIEVFTALLRNGTLLYVLAVSPRESAAIYAQTFRRVVASIEIMDCEGCVR